MAKNASEDTMVKRRHSRPLVLESEEEEDEENSENVEDPKSVEVHVSAQVLFHLFDIHLYKKINNSELKF